jgi:predicted nucleic acid-binding protein
MKNTPYLVVDASIVLKWQLDDEEYVTEALALRDAWIKKQAVRLLAPTLLIYEVVNGFSPSEK